MSSSNEAVERKSASCEVRLGSSVPEVSKLRELQIEAQVEKENFHQFNSKIHKEKEMADFRKLFYALAVVALLACFTIPAAAQGLLCTS